MIENVKENSAFSPEQEETIDLRKLFEKLVEHWKWFVVAIPVGVVLAFGYCVLQTPEYDVVSKVMVNDSKKGDLGANLVMQELGFAQGDMFVENEMIELQSKNLIREVVRALDLNVRYIREGFPRDVELYGNSPISVLVDHPERIADTSFRVVSDGARGLILQDPEGEEIWRGHFSDSISFAGYAISIERNGDGKFDEILVRIVASGICHTDLVCRDQFIPVPLPAVLGHVAADPAQGALGPACHHSPPPA